MNDAASAVFITVNDHDKAAVVPIGEREGTHALLVVERAVETARERGEPTGKVLVEISHDADHVRKVRAGVERRAAARAWGRRDVRAGPEADAALCSRG